MLLVGKDSAPLSLLGSYMSYWVYQECKVLTVLFWGCFSGSCLQSNLDRWCQVSLWDKDLVFLLLALKAMDSPNSVFPGYRQTRCEYSIRLGPSTSLPWDLKKGQRKQTQTWWCSCCWLSFECQSPLFRTQESCVLRQYPGSINWLVYSLIRRVKYQTRYHHTHWYV